MHEIIFEVLELFYIKNTRAYNIIVYYVNCQMNIKKKVRLGQKLSCK